jgi:hypothetical protein
LSHIKCQTCPKIRLEHDAASLHIPLSFPFVKLAAIMRSRRGVFGGTAGLWLLQKKNRVQKGETLVSPIAQEGKMNHRLTSLQSTEGSADESFTLKKDAAWIGWDDEQCCPVCDDHLTALTQPPSSSSFEKNDSNASVGSPPENGNKPNTPKEMLIRTTTTANKGRRGIFVVRKRHFVPVTETRSSPSSDDSSMSSSVQENKRICLLSSCSSQSLGMTNSGMIGKADADSCPDVDSNDLTDKGLSKHGTNNIDDPKLSRDSVPSSVVDFEKYQGEIELAGVRQPGFRTSVSVACAFFALLDSDQTLLTLEGASCSQEPCSGKQQRNITTRRGKLKPKVVKAEYRKYCTVCLESKVKPLPIERFLEQRTTFFRQGDVFDGMFDE